MSDIEVALAKSLFVQGFAAGASAAKFLRGGQPPTDADTNWLNGYYAGLGAAREATKVYAERLGTKEDTNG